MSSPLTPDEQQRYSSIIDAILATADLETITRKKIIKGLETSLGGRDLSDQKHAVKKLIEARFDAVSGVDTGADAEVDGGVDAVSVPTPDSTSHKRAASDGVSGDSGRSTSPEPARKKTKRSSSVEDADAKLAAQLQAQENSLARSRTTRGGDKSKSRNKKAAPRKKSSKKVKADDDSDVESGSATPKRKAGGGFQKPFNLSEPLAEVCGETQLSRPQVVKKLWEHIKANSLQDPSDRRQILCDEKMQAVFKTTKVDMFKMNKEIGSHLYPVGEE